MCSSCDPHLSLCLCVQKSRYNDQPLPSEGYIGSVVTAHVAGLSSVAAPSIGLSLKHLLHCLVRVAEALFT